MTKSITQTSIAEVQNLQVAVKLSRPLFLAGVPAGFPSPADDYIEKSLDLNEHLVRNPAATFFVRVVGNSMIDAGINGGDILVVDRSLEPTNGRVVIAVLDGELTVKRLIKKNGTVRLVADNAGYPELEVSEGADLQIWGVVAYTIHQP